MTRWNFAVLPEEHAEMLESRGNTAQFFRQPPQRVEIPDSRSNAAGSSVWCSSPAQNSRSSSLTWRKFHSWPLSVYPPQVALSPPRPPVLTSTFVFVCICHKYIQNTNTSALKNLNKTKLKNTNCVFLNLVLFRFLSALVFVFCMYL